MRSISFPSNFNTEEHFDNNKSGAYITQLKKGKTTKEQEVREQLRYI
jgi:hypothetical protein